MGGGGIFHLTFRKTKFTQNFTLVSEYVIDWLFKWMSYVTFETFLVIVVSNKCDFVKILNGQQQSYSSRKKKVPKTTKFCLIELQLDYAKFFDLR